MAHTAAQFIDAHGGSETFGRAIGQNANYVRVMKHRGRLPRKVWPEILEAFPDITLDDLRAIEGAPKKTAAA